MDKISHTRVYQNGTAACQKIQETHMAGYLPLLPSLSGGGSIQLSNGKGAALESAGDISVLPEERFSSRQKRK